MTERGITKVRAPAMILVRLTVMSIPSPTRCFTASIRTTKATDKKYYHHTGFPGGIKSISFEKLIDKAPERALEKAVKGMLPKGPLGRAMYGKLKVYAGDAHPHAAQQPQALNI